MTDVREWFSSIKARLAGLHARVIKHLDERAERDKAGWGSKMEYKRRYTNPDEAKRNRTPPADLP